MNRIVRIAIATMVLTWVGLGVASQPVHAQVQIPPDDVAAVKGRREAAGVELGWEVHPALADTRG